nr:hypothetical protein [Tanacetum cinerariifolium]
MLGIKCSKAFPLLVMKIPLLEYFATASDKEFPLLSCYVTPAEEFALLMKIRITLSQRRINLSQRRVLVILGIIQQYLQNEHYALWEVIEFGDSYKAPQEEAASESSAKKKGRTVVITTEDMQKRRNDVKARTTLLLALPDEHQLRFRKYETAKKLWEAILKTFGGNEATKKTKKNQLKQQYGNFKAECSETLEQTFNRLQAIVSHLEFMNVEIKQDDLNQKFLTSLAPEWLMHTIVWRNRDDLDTMSPNDVYNHLKVYEPEVQKKSESNSQNMVFISSANTSSGKGKVHTASVPTASTQVFTASADVAAASISHDIVCAYIASQYNGSQIKYKDITQIDQDDIKEMDIKWNMALLSMRADKFWKKTSKKITIQGTDVAGFDKSKVKCFNCHKMGHFARECRAPRSQDRGRRESYKQGSKEEEPAPKALIAIDGTGWDWSYMASEEENHALVADDEALIEFSLMAKSRSSSENEVEARLVEFKTQEIKFYEKIRGIEIDVEFKNNKIKYLMNELEQVKKEKEGLNSKLIGFESALKDLDTLLGSQRTDKNKEGLGYSAILPLLLKPSPSIESNTSDLQNTTDSLTVNKTNKVETARKSSVKYAEMYRNTSKSPKVRGTSRIGVFIEFSWYALTINPIVYVLHIRQFWSTARIKTTNEGTKILATVDGKPMTIFESSIRRNLKLNDEEGISSLPDTELFENPALMGYNIFPNQRFTFQKGQFFHQWKFLIHTIMQCLSPKSTGLNEFSSNIATVMVKDKQEKDKIRTKQDKNKKRGKAQQCQSPVTIKKA